MAETFLTFDFGTNEEAAQQARHKLERWKQAFRLDKKLLFKFDRDEGPGQQAPETPSAEGPEKSKDKGKPKKEEKPAARGGSVKLLVRLYFSDHEKLSQQRWIERIPHEEPFKSAAPHAVASGNAAFAATRGRFETLD